MFQSYCNSFENLSLFSTNFARSLNPVSSDISSDSCRVAFHSLILCSSSFSPPDWLLSTHSAQPRVNSAPEKFPLDVLVSFLWDEPNSFFGYPQSIKLVGATQVWMSGNRCYWIGFYLLFYLVLWLAAVALILVTAFHKIVSDLKLSEMRHRREDEMKTTTELDNQLSQPLFILKLEVCTFDHLHQIPPPCTSGNHKFGLFFWVLFFALFCFLPPNFIYLFIDHHRWYLFFIVLNF